MDRVARPHFTSADHHAHDAAEKRAGTAVVQQMRQETWPKPVDLGAWVSTAGEADFGLAHGEFCAFAQMEQVNATGSNILPQIAGLNAKPLLRDDVE
jgi:uncharacterized cupin superfamily protein